MMMDAITGYDLVSEEAQRVAHSIVETVREPLVVLDRDFRVKLANRSFYQTFQMTEQETHDAFLFSLADGQWNIPGLRSRLAEILQQGTQIQDFKVDREFPTIGRKIMLLNARGLFEKASCANMILLAIEDITERKSAQEMFSAADHDSVEEYERLLDRLASLALMFGTARDLQAIFRGLRDFSLSLTPSFAMLICLYDEARQVREGVYCSVGGAEVDAPAVGPVPVGAGPGGRVIRTRAAVICNDFLTDVRGRKQISIGDEADSDKPRSALIVPMITMGHIVGTIEVQSHELAAYTREHVTAMQMAANLAANAIENVRLLEREREQEEQLRQAQKMEAIGTLAGGIAHDFNNILNAILGYSELAVSDLPSQHEVQAYLAEVLKASGRAKELVRQILTFSRKQAPERKPIDFQQVLEEALKLLRASLPSMIEICQFIDEEVPLISGDPSQIHQVMMNLATNAMHAMTERGGRLEVRLNSILIDAEFAQTHADLHEGRYVRLIVSDSGCGMDQHTLKRMFDPFFTTKGPGEGTGLGLATVYGIVRDHDGAILVSSERGKGTTFNIYFPVREDLVAEQINTSDPSPQGCGQRVLLVEDEVPLAILGKKRLERLGYKVTMHTGSVEALESFQSSPDEFDLVITDYNMPRMNGADLARSILSLRPKLPVILVTGYGNAISTEGVAAIGIRELLMKPTTMKTLGEAVSRALEVKKEV